MIILAIDTSCDETAAAVVNGRKVLSNVVYSQILLHRRWGGVVPSLAKRAHQEKIDLVIETAINKLKSFGQPAGLSVIQAVAVTQGPGLAVALEVGINKAKQLAESYHKQLIAVNHLEGHLYSPFVQNRSGNPQRQFQFPYLGLIISGGHTELVIFSDHLKYQLIGKTVDDAAGEALDKAGKLLGLGYPGGPVIERLAAQVNNEDEFCFPRPMLRSNDLNFSFSGLKTAFYYLLKRSPHLRIKKLNQLASSFQQAVVDVIVAKTDKAIRQTKIKHVIAGGGVVANHYLRKQLRHLLAKHRGEILFPPYSYLTGDNAAMIGVAASYYAKKGLFVRAPHLLDRQPRMTF